MADILSQQQDTLNEKSDTQTFWLTLIRDVFGVINPEDYIQFEKRVLIDNIGFIDAYIPSTGIIIEQKSPGKNLDAAFSQAKNYYDWLPVSQRGRYILTCDFTELHVHDLETPKAPPVIIPISELSRDKIDFLLTPGETMPIEERISIEAGKLIRKLYKHLRASLDELFPNANMDNGKYQNAVDDLNIFCVRLVFLLYAEDSGLFRRNQFHDYLAGSKAISTSAMTEIFYVLKTEPDKRRINLDNVLRDFPLVDGGLFEKDIEFPPISNEALYIIIHDMSESFNWAGISPTIFGAIFESAINEYTRKAEGIHYTSIKNIHKIIDPLFLDELNADLDKLLALPESQDKFSSLTAFQDKLASLRFLDPACGSGNFLTESFIHIRRIENKILAALPENLRPAVKVSITQFHGIEVHDFAVNVAKTALWISDHQMWKETENIIRSNKPYLPLKEYDHIKEGSAMDELPNLGWKLPGWKVEHPDMLYIMGNPPFLGYSQQTPRQKDEVKAIFGQAKSDYVACWFWKAAEYLSQDPNTKAAFVATSSIVQGEQPAYVFGKISARFPVKIEYAHTPFVWENELPEQSKMARVHVVVVAFSTCPPEMKKLYTPEGVRLVKNINFYLADGPDEDFAVPTKKTVSENFPAMIAGSMPLDGGKTTKGGGLIINGEDYADFVKREPGALKYIRRFMGGYEFINNSPRYCLWLVGAEPAEIRKMPLVYERVKAVEKFRKASERSGTKNAAHESWLFAEIRQPEGNYIAIPKTSSEERLYIPMGWLDSSVIAGDGLRILPDATLYDFGVLTSRVHMAWMRRVGGRLEMSYRYSNTLVYNTFPWPSPSPKLRRRIEQSAQAILTAREAHPSNTFADLYDDSLMPADLRLAHALNYAAVCAAYGWPEDISENDIVTQLFRLYHELSGK